MARRWRHLAPRRGEFFPTAPTAQGPPPRAIASRRAALALARRGEFFTLAPIQPGAPFRAVQSRRAGLAPARRGAFFAVAQANGTAAPRPITAHRPIAAQPRRGQFYPTPAAHNPPPQWVGRAFTKLGPPRRGSYQFAPVPPPLVPVTAPPARLTRPSTRPTPLRVSRGAYNFTWTMPAPYVPPPPTPASRQPAVPAEWRTPVVQAENRMPPVPAENRIVKVGAS